MSGTQVLLADRNGQWRQQTRQLLEHAGYRVTLAHDVTEVSANHADGLPDLVITTGVEQGAITQARLADFLTSKSATPLLVIGGTVDTLDALQLDGDQHCRLSVVDGDVSGEALLDAVERLTRTPKTTKQFVARDPASRQLLKLASRVACSQATVMITGESGTGKEVLARYLHDHSPRANGPFIAVNCAAIPESMLEAVLFGYQKGAFTGAHQTTVGKFELAQGGTFLLDEISEMDLALQSKLLRVLQEKEVEKLGSSRTVKLDVRVLATSNRALLEQVRAGRFREDLYYRLTVFPLRIKPLRERRLDIVPLADAILRKAALENNLSIPYLTDAATRWLEDEKWTWPGNVRQLENLLQRAVILSNGQEIHVEDLETDLIDSPVHRDALQAVESNSHPDADADKSNLDSYLKAHEYRHIKRVLLSVNGSKKQAAEKLGISQRTLRYKLAQLRQDSAPIAVGAEPHVVM